jgi:hypothetical protein
MWTNVQENQIIPYAFAGKVEQTISQLADITDVDEALFST